MLLLPTVDDDNLVRYVDVQYSMEGEKSCLAEKIARYGLGLLQQLDNHDSARLARYRKMSMIAIIIMPSGHVPLGVLLRSDPRAWLLRESRV